VLLVVDDAEEAKKNIESESESVIIIDLTTALLNATSTTTRFRSVEIQTDPIAKKRIFGFLFAISKGLLLVSTHAR